MIKMSAQNTNKGGKNKVIKNKKYKDKGENKKYEQ